MSKLIQFFTPKIEFILVISMAFLLLVSVVLLERDTMETMSSSVQSQSTNKNVVVIDPGHGAADSGKIGINDIYEKDINLQIALKLKKLLEAQDMEVYLTREDDIGLYPAEGDNKKIQDMKNRVHFIEEKNPILTVSIHQNSYEDAKIHGAQVFYFDRSEKGKAAAKLMQKQLAISLDPSNSRQIQPNTSYYLLKKVSSPIVIVECGFLSNPDESHKLTNVDYQEKIAWAIHLGILQYKNSPLISK